MEQNILEELKNGKLPLKALEVKKYGNSFYLRINPAYLQLGILKEGDKFDANVEMDSIDTLGSLCSGSDYYEGNCEGVGVNA